MMIKKISGRHAATGVVSLLVCLLSGNTAFAWQQEYIVSDNVNNTTERYTWDDDHQPRYEDILAERIRSSQNAPAVSVNLADASSAMPGSTMSVGVNIPVARRITTGPIVSWRYDGSPSTIYNDFGDSVSTSSLTDPLWHASVSTLGWRVDSHLGGLRPWAQISYNQQFGDNQWKSQAGFSKTAASQQPDSWMDVTVGADIPLYPHMAAYASLSQSESMVLGEDYLYTLGVSAKF